MEIGFCLGSNLGNRLQWLRWAKTRLTLCGYGEFADQSSVYETEPVGVREAYREMRFLNAVLILQSEHSAQDWLGVIKQIEADLDRVRTTDRNAPRTIDIDILFVGDQIVESDWLQVPHPRWAERRFVVQPLAEVRGTLVLPGSIQTVRNVLRGMGPSEEVRLFADRW